MEIAVQRLIDFLDSVEDTDTDAAVDDEPIDGDEREIEDEHDELTNDEEPSLGSVGNAHQMQSQAGWAQGASDDREDEHDGTEYDEDFEPQEADGGESAGPSPKFIRKLRRKRSHREETLARQPADGSNVQFVRVRIDRVS
jgi:hypothetical protein